MLKHYWKLFNREWPWHKESPEGGQTLPPEIVQWLHIECKNRKSLSFWEAFKQASEDTAAAGKAYWFVVVKRTGARDGPFVCVPQELFDQLLEEFCKTKV
ncbi:MAG: hypothetical protein HKM89_10770 [Gemmatimonadales bacterium]|nr:hypothetical protein [Gemmatimonadales bacterium]